MKFLSMLSLVFVLSACNGSSSNASEPVPPTPPPSGPITSKVPASATPIYFLGQQSINLTNQAECYVELRFSDDKQFAEVRAIVTNPHELADDPDHAVVGLGVFELEKKFLGGSLQTEGYYYEDKEPMAAVKQLLIFGDATNVIGELRAAIIHGGHHDPVSCTNLIEAKDQKLSDVIEMYTHFEEYKEHLGGEDEDHADHDHD